MSISDCILQDVLMSSSGQASRFQRKPCSTNFQTSGRFTSRLLIASLMLSVSSVAVLASDDGQSNSKSEQATKKSESDSRGEEAAKKSAADPKGEQASKKSASEEAMAKKLAAMERRMQSLEIELKLKEHRLRRTDGPWMAGC